MGSEMCIRDRSMSGPEVTKSNSQLIQKEMISRNYNRITSGECKVCLLYTSDAADERSSVDLGGRRIIKKERTYQKEW